MGFRLHNQGLNWLYLGQGALGGSLGGRRRPASGRDRVQGTTEAAFRLAQDRAVDRIDSQARTVRSVIQAVELPPGERITGLKTALPSAGGYWTGQAGEEAAPEIHLARVTSLSKTQTNLSKPLVSSGSSDLDAGTYVLELTEGEAEPTEIEVRLSYEEPFPDDNLAALRRLATAIESAAGDLSARVITGFQEDRNGLSEETVRLEVRANSSGTEFSLEDVTGDLVQTLDLDRRRSGGQELTYLQGTQWATPFGKLSQVFRREAGTEYPEPVWTRIPPQSGSQINRSLALTPEGTADLPAGSYSIELANALGSRELDLSIDYHGIFPDDNQAILNRLAQTLGSAGLGVEARVDQVEALDSEAQSSLVLVLTASDQEPFSLKDLEGKLISGLGLERPFVTPAGTRGAEDGFSLDQGQVETRAWQVFPESDQSLTVALAGLPLLNQVETVALAHNGFLSVLKAGRAYVDQSPGQELTRDLLLNQGTYRSVGIQVGRDGRLAVGEGLETSLQRDLPGVREALEGEDGLLEVIDNHLAEALDQGFEDYKKGRSGLIYNDPPGSAGQGYNPYARVRPRGNSSGGMSRGSWILSQVV